jgi:predicted Zn-dependent protease
MQSFRPLTDAAKLNKKPDRVRIKTVRENSTLEQVLRGFNVPDRRVEEMAILNGMKRTDRVTQGMLIK